MRKHPSTSPAAEQEHATGAPGLTRRGFLGALGGLTAASLLAGNRVAGPHRPPDNAMLPKPTPEQLAWQDLEVGMFFHFGMRTYDDSQGYPPPDPSLYNPTELDTDQWLEAARALGAKYAVLVAKHNQGFLLWQSDAYPYGVRQSPWRGGKGDVVRDFIESCHRYGIQPGIYACVTTNVYLQSEDPGRVQGGDPERQRAYARTCEQMLTELWSRYGELTEIWFDGGVLPPEQGGPNVVPLIEKYQPHAMVFGGPATIRFVGNEHGHANYPCWATVPSMDSINLPPPGQSRVDWCGFMGTGDPDGQVWLPAECCVTVRDYEWFWKPDQEDKLYPPLEYLMGIYYQSVGRNCNLLFNANPDRRGLVPEADFQRYVEFGREIRRRFRHLVGETSGEGRLLELRLPGPRLVDHVVLMEDIAHGERVRKYEVQGRVGEEWRPLCDGQSIGHKRIQEFPPVEVSAVRLRVRSSVEVPLIRKLQVYCAAGT